MTQLLQEKRLATKFQILVEVAANQPHIQQKAIAGKIQITTQAVSLYIKEMVDDGWIHQDARSNLRVTKEGVDWLLKSLREMHRYLTRVDKVSRNISVCAAIAGCDLFQGQQVGLAMKDGRLIASTDCQQKANGIAVTCARTGDDVGVSSIEGIMDLVMVKVTILKIPVIQKGGSRKVDLARLKENVSNSAIVGAIGIEAVVSLKLAGIVPQYTCGVKEAAIETAQCGLYMVVACVSNEVPLLTQALDDKHIEYIILDMEMSG